MKNVSLKTLDKAMAKKNAELQELHDFRRKLDDKEKKICADIEKLQNQKVEIIFEQVKKEIRHENLDVTSASALAILEVLRNVGQIVQSEKSAEEI